MQDLFVHFGWSKSRTIKLPVPSHMVPLEYLGQI